MALEVFERNKLRKDQIKLLIQLRPFVRSVAALAQLTLLSFIKELSENQAKFKEKDGLIMTAHITARIRLNFKI